MDKLTFISIPKAFSGHIGIIQKNAIRSWCRIPNSRVVLFGNETGMKDFARETQVIHIPDIPTNAHGTPLLPGVFNHNFLESVPGRIVYINADIILLSDFPKAIECVPSSGVVMGGRRWDTDITEEIDFSATDWEQKIRTFALNTGSPHGLTGIDYFLFDKGIFDPIPPFAIGRFYWDMWLLYQARKNGAKVVDASSDVLAIHQNHNYTHVANTTTLDDLWKSEETFENYKQVQGSLMHLGNANYQLCNGKLQPAKSLNPTDVSLALAIFAERKFPKMKNPFVWVARQFWDRKSHLKFKHFLEKQSVASS